jgi:acyl phosphate:glycerol-3-phosphate acyltransferase
VLENILIIASGYLIGSIPFGVVVVKLFRGEDIRKQGSGNIGASNVWRAYGRWLGVPVALLDVAKGFVPALIGVKLGGEWVGVLAGAAAMLGHARPIWLGFSKGGKMVATGGGVVLALAPLAAGICLLVWLATFVLFRYASLASLVAAVALPIFCLLLGEPWPTVIFATVASLAVIALHRQNIGRLLHGTESRFTRGKGSSSGASSSNASSTR